MVHGRSSNRRVGQTHRSLRINSTRCVDLTHATGIAVYPLGAAPLVGLAAGSDLAAGAGASAGWVAGLAGSAPALSASAFASGPVPAAGAAGAAGAPGAVAVVAAGEPPGAGGGVASG